MQKFKKLTDTAPSQRLSVTLLTQAQRCRRSPWKTDMFLVTLQESSGLGSFLVTLCCLYRKSGPRRLLRGRISHSLHRAQHGEKSLGKGPGHSSRTAPWPVTSWGDQPPGEAASPISDSPNPEGPARDSAPCGSQKAPLLPLTTDSRFPKRGSGHSPTQRLP